MPRLAGPALSSKKLPKAPATSFGNRLLAPSLAVAASRASPSMQKPEHSDPTPKRLRGQQGEKLGAEHRHSNRAANHRLCGPELRHLPGGGGPQPGWTPARRCCRWSAGPFVPQMQPSQDSGPAPLFFLLHVPLLPQALPQPLRALPRAGQLLGLPPHVPPRPTAGGTGGGDTGLRQDTRREPEQNEAGGQVKTDGAWSQEDSSDSTPTRPCRAGESRGQSAARGEAHTSSSIPSSVG